jgi:hypothetical protein
MRFLHDTRPLRGKSGRKKDGTQRATGSDVPQPRQETGMKSVSTMVREVLARRVHREAASMGASLHLQHDLHLRPLEVALVTLDLEEAVGVPMSCQEIASIGTVGELASFVSTAVAASRRSRHADIIARYFAQTSEE